MTCIFSQAGQYTFYGKLEKCVLRTFKKDLVRSSADGLKIWIWRSITMKVKWKSTWKSFIESLLVVQHHFWRTYLKKYTKSVGRLVIAKVIVGFWNLQNFYFLENYSCGKICDTRKITQSSYKWQIYNFAPKKRFCFNNRIL